MTQSVRRRTSTRSERDDERGDQRRRRARTVVARALQHAGVQAPRTPLAMKATRGRNPARASVRCTHEKSYVHVIGARAAANGYGGRTQEWGSVQATG